MLCTVTGKYIRVELSPAGVVQGGHVSTYLLEKIRVVQQVLVSMLTSLTACCTAHSLYTVLLNKTLACVSCIV
jgi:hypothetical protein